MSTSDRKQQAIGRDEEGSLCRGGVLQSDEHRPPTIPVEYLLAFVRAIIRISPSEDAIALAIIQAGEAFPLTEEQSKAFREAVSHEVDQSVWPKGFF